jgi:hypothetical protein
MTIDHKQKAGGQKGVWAEIKSCFHDDNKGGWGNMGQQKMKSGPPPERQKSLTVICGTGALLKVRIRFPGSGIQPNEGYNA